jgi:hypothetical protein
MRYDYSSHVIHKRVHSIMYEPHYIPSLEKIEQMEKKRSQAIEALEISDHHVKCQRCGVAVPREFIRRICCYLPGGS